VEPTILASSWPDLPIILRGVYEVIDLGIDELKDTLFGRLLVIPEELRC
jgi:hypothetical protein